MYRNRQPSIFPMAVCKADKFYKYKTHKQGREKIKSRILIGGYTEISTFFVAWACQVYFVITGYLTKLFILEYLQPGTQADNDAAADGIGGLFKNIEGAFAGWVTGSISNKAFNSFSELIVSSL